MFRLLKHIMKPHCSQNVSALQSRSGHLSCQVPKWLTVLFWEGLHFALAAASVSFQPFIFHRHFDTEEGPEVTQCQTWRIWW